MLRKKHLFSGWRVNFFQISNILVCLCREKGAMARDEERNGHGMTNGSAEVVPLVHKVEVPPKRNVFKEIGSGLYELFFHDAPLDQFKGQSRRRKGLLGLKFVFPILEWITTYTPKMLLGDIIAGCTIASLAIPQVRIPLCSQSHCTRTPSFTGNPKP